jgi:hypothetical protein
MTLLSIGMIVPDWIPDLILDLIPYLIPDLILDLIPYLIPDLIPDLIKDLIPGLIPDLIPDLIKDLIRDLIIDRHNRHSTTEALFPTKSEISTLSKSLSTASELFFHLILSQSIGSAGGASFIERGLFLFSIAHSIGVFFRKAAFTTGLSSFLDASNSLRICSITLDP